MSICQKKCSPRLPRFHFFRSTREIRSCRFETPAKIRTSRSRSRSMPSNQAILDLMPCDIPVAKLAWMEHGYSRDTYRMLGCSALKKHGHGQRPCACKAWRMLGRYGFLVIKRAKWPVHICAPPGPNNAHNTSGHHLDDSFMHIYILLLYHIYLFVRQSPGQGAAACNLSRGAPFAGISICSGSMTNGTTFILQTLHQH